jgi:hypothetical protein
MLNAVPTLYVTVIDRLSPPLVPVTVTVNVVDVTEGVQDSVEVPEEEVVVSATLVGLRPQVRPEEGEIVSVKPTVPVNPLALATVTVDVPVVPEKTKTLVGLALTVKSCTLYVTLDEWLSEDPVPVTVTV